MSGTLRGLVGFVFTVVGLGSLFSGHTSYPFPNLQQALVAEVYRSLTFHLAPLSALMGEGITLERYGFVVSTGNGVHPLLSLLLAGAVAGVCAGRAGSAAAPLLGSAMIFGLWQLMGFYVLSSSLGDHSWVTAIDRMNEFLLIERPLELIALFTVPLPVSIGIGHLIDRSRQEGPLLTVSSLRR
ncbi:MAG: hypothetical protein NZ988_04035 [Thaumarchaeota archaeon]|nr:hypothetical protein [Candidatus Calditenuaceae archaeon]MDW8187199.1 hypothetical protein [Nitrososphaerota archaeon]